jgi:hypothetical protein
MHRTPALRALILAFAAVPAMVAPAAVINLTADNTIGTSSFASSLAWSNGAAPSAGNDYFNNAFLLRTPADANNYTFGGDSLTITSSNATLGGDLNDSLLYKGSLSSTLTINNFTVNGGALRQAQSETQVFTLAGNSLTIGALGMAVHVQGPLVVTSPVQGSGIIRVVDNGSSDARRTLELASGANTYTGNIQLPTANRSRLRLQPTGNLNFVIGAAGTSNTITGSGVLTLDGIFNIDLSGASSTLGDTWQLVANSTLAETYSATFAVAGFLDNGDNTWSAAANGAQYQFSEATGALTVVPEPAALSLVAIGAGLLARRRRA